MQDDNKRPTVEDQELADMIASINSGGTAANTGTATPSPAPSGPAARPATSPVGSSFTPPVTPAPPSAPIAAPSVPVGTMTVPNGPTPLPAPTTPTPMPNPPIPTPKPAAPPSPVSKPASPVNNLGVIKQNALDELRPLVDRLDLPADERFDTLLLLIRSTDDKALIKPAHEAAQSIKDDTKRAQALLDIVKEIDFFEHQD